MSKSYGRHTRHNTTVPADDFISFRADIIRNGGHVFRSAPCGAGYAVSYVLPVDDDAEVSR